MKGGGIYVNDAAVTLTHLTIMNNEARVELLAPAYTLKRAPSSYTTASSLAAAAATTVQATSPKAEAILARTVLAPRKPAVTPPSPI